MVVAAADEKFDTLVSLVIVGAGAAGLCAALAAKERGIDAVVVERDDVPAGSTALSAGLIPAAGTRFQRDKGIADSPDLFAADIQRKAKGEADRAVVETVAAGAAPLVEWLADRYGLPFEVVDNFNYPGHSAMRMHGLAEPDRTRADRPAAQCRRSERHCHSGEKHGATDICGFRKPYPRRRGRSPRRQLRAHRL